MAELRHAFCYTPAEMGARSLPTQPIPVAPAIRERFPTGVVQDARAGAR